MADYSETSSALLPCTEMMNIAMLLSALTGKTIVMDYWIESLHRDQKIMVVGLIGNTSSSARRTFILMKSRQEFTSPIVEYHEICYFVNDGKSAKTGACGYIFLTQNSIYLVKFPIKMGALSMADYDKLNREVDSSI